MPDRQLAHLSIEPMTNGTQRCIWVPAAELKRTRPDFRIAFICPNSEIGRRHFIPESPGQLLRCAWRNGFAIGAHQNDWTRSTTDWHQLAWFLYQRIQHSREFLSRRFRGVRDLQIRDWTQFDSGKDILPVDLGVDAAGTGKRWSISRLLNEGARQIANQPFRRKTYERIINFGLYAAATRNPLTGLSRPEIHSVVRRSLFMPDPSRPTITPKIRQQVVERLGLAVRAHLSDSNYEFDGWFQGAKNSLITQLAKQKSAPGGVIPIEIVRDVLVDLGWRAFISVNRCIDLQFRAFENAITPRLTPEERLWFGRYYRSQKYWAGMSFIVMMPRMEVLSPIALIHLGICEANEDTWVPVAHRLLHYYFEMAERRREVDRRRKGG